MVAGDPAFLDARVLRIRVENHPCRFRQQTQRGCQRPVSIRVGRIGIVLLLLACLDADHLHDLAQNGVRERDGLTDEAGEEPGIETDDVGIVLAVHDDARRAQREPLRARLRVPWFPEHGGRQHAGRFDRRLLEGVDLLHARDDRHPRRGVGERVQWHDDRRQLGALDDPVEPCERIEDVLE